MLTKCRVVRRRMWIKCIDADDLVVCARRQVSAVAREAYRVDGTGMIAHRGQLLWAIEGRIGRPEDGLGGPNANITIYQYLVNQRYPFPGMTNLQRPSPVWSHQVRHGSCKPQSPSFLRYGSAILGEYSAWQRINSLSLRRIAHGCPVKRD